MTNKQIAQKYTYKQMLKTYYKKLYKEGDAYLGESATDAQNDIYDWLLYLVYGHDRLPF